MSVDPYEWLSAAFRYYGFAATWSVLVVLGLFVVDLVAFLTASAIARARR